VPKKLIADVAKFRLGEVADRKKTSAITREKTRHALLIE